MISIKMWGPREIINIQQFIEIKSNGANNVWRVDWFYPQLFFKQTYLNVFFQYNDLRHLTKFTTTCSFFDLVDQAVNF